MSLRKRLAGLTRPFRRAFGGGAAVQRLAAVKRRPVDGDRYFYLGADLGLVRLNIGPLLHVDPQDEQICAGIIATGAWEPWVSAVVLSLLPRGGRVVEVGANVGYYTMTMAARVGPEGHITALEANPRLVGLIGRSTRLNGYADRVRLVPRAAMDAPGEVDFVAFRNNSGGGHVPVVANAWYDEILGTPERFRVEAVRLDDLDCGPVDLVRIDAEGSEPFILKGASELLRANPDVVLCLEWSAAQIASRTSLTGFVDWLEGLGFRFWLIGPPKGLSPLSREALLNLTHADIVAARREPVLR